MKSEALGLDIEAVSLLVKADSEYVARMHEVLSRQLMEFDASKTHSFDFEKDQKQAVLGPRLQDKG